MENVFQFWATWEIYSLTGISGITISQLYRSEKSCTQPILYCINAIQRKWEFALKLSFLLKYYYLVNFREREREIGTFALLLSMKRLNTVLYFESGKIRGYSCRNMGDYLAVNSLNYIFYKKPGRYFSFVQNHWGNNQPVSNAPLIE